jgi:excisionase family DNA binding protein
LSASDSRPAPARIRLLSVKEIARTCQLSEKAIRRAIDDGELPAVKLRSRLRVTPQDFEAWINSSRRRNDHATISQPTRLPRRAPAGSFRALIQDDRGASL